MEDFVGISEGEIFLGSFINTRAISFLDIILLNDGWIY